MAEAAPGVIRVTDWYSLRKVVFYDNNYPCSWVTNSAELARAFIGAGFAPLTAFQLREWMRAQLAGGAEGSICFFAQDVMPDMVAEQRSPACLVMEYLKAGGRVVWVGDIPFYYQGQNGGKKELWGNEAQKIVLGLDSRWDLKDEVRVTETGRDWGLTAPDTPSRCVPAGQVTAALTVAGNYAVSFFNRYNCSKPESGFLRLREFMPAPDLLRAAQYGIEEPEDIGEGQGPSRAQASADGGELVGSGTFVVDRQRALDKLMRFQLPDPETCLLPLIRCALAGKATEIVISEPAHGGLQIKYDGELFTRERLADPYSAIFETKSAANAAARHLATGLLCALRLKPQVITVSTGPAGSRFRLKIDELGREAIQPSEAPGEGTVVHLLWRGFAPLRNGRLLTHVRARCALSPVPVVINGREMPRSGGNTGAPGLYFEDGGLSGFLAVPETASPISTISVSVNNVLLEMPLSVKLPYLQVSGYLNNDDFTMNISQTGVVNNTRCARTLTVVNRNIPGLLAHILQCQAQNFPAAGKMMVYGGMHAHWKKCVESGLPPDPGLLGGLLKEVAGSLIIREGLTAAKREKAERFVRDTARVTLWLREACARLLSDYKRDSAGKLQKALWEAPLVLTINGEARSLRQVAEQQERMGFVPYSRSPSPDTVLPFDVLWLASFRDMEPLRRWNTADLTGEIPFYGANPAAAEEFLGGAYRMNIEIVPPSRPMRQDMQPVEILLADIKAPEPAKPPPAPAAAKARPAGSRAPLPPSAPPAKPLPAEERLVKDPAAAFPEFLALLAARIEAPGAGLAAKFIREEAGSAKWMKKPLAADILAAPLPPLRKAEYLLSVFYTDFNRREVKLTDTDDMKFQRALAELIQRGGK